MNIMSYKNQKKKKKIIIKKREQEFRNQPKG